MWGRRIVLSLGSSPLLEEGEEGEEREEREEGGGRGRRGRRERWGIRIVLSLGPSPLLDVRNANPLLIECFLPKRNLVISAADS